MGELPADQRAVVHLKLWEGLEEALDFDVQFSQRGVLNLSHDLGDVRSSMRRVNANRLNGVDAEWVTPQQVKELCPIININDDIRYPVLGGTFQPRAGIAKHDWVAWGYARRANEITQGKDPEVLDTLARVLFMKGQKDSAIEYQTKAVEFQQQCPIGTKQNGCGTGEATSNHSAQVSPFNC